MRKGQGLLALMSQGHRLSQKADRTSGKAALQPWQLGNHSTPEGAWVTSQQPPHHGAVRLCEAPGSTVLRVWESGPWLPWRGLGSGRVFLSGAGHAGRGAAEWVSLVSF